MRARLADRVADLAEVDPGQELVRLVRRLIAASEADPLNMALVKELRATLVALPPRREMDPLEIRQARVAAIRAEHAAGLVGNVVPFKNPWARIAPKEG